MTEKSLHTWEMYVYNIYTYVHLKEYQNSSKFENKEIDWNLFR